MTPRVVRIGRQIGTHTSFSSDKRLGLLYPVALLWGAMILAVAVLIWYTGDFSGSRDNYYLLPWCFATGIVVIAPIAYTVYQRKFDPYHPVVFASWSFFLPGFFIGGLTLALGLSQPYYLAYVLDERYNLPLTFLYVILGFLGLIVGFVLPFGRRIGSKIASWLPVWEWMPNQVLKPALLLLGFGLLNTAIGFAFGFLGYQKTDQIGAYDGIIFLLSLLWLEASFLLWLYVFRSHKLNTTHFLVIAALLITSFTKSAFQGNRGSLITVFVLISFAYVAAGKKIGLKQTFAGGIIIVIALLIGMIYGTTFRGIKQNQEAMQIEQYSSVVGETFSAISEQDLAANLSKGFGALAERLDSISPLAVVVSNYEKLLPYEESYGLANNILMESATFFVPRVLWTEKPVATDASKYGDLYFNYPDNAFTLTPMGDLLRNFGPYGVPLGMLFLGFILRIIYSSLRENQPFSFWRATIFFMLLTAVSYEGSYALIIPYLFKVGFISIVGILIVRFFAGRGFAQNSTKAA